jgi:hypothetical protein
MAGIMVKFPMTIPCWLSSWLSQSQMDKRNARFLRQSGLVEILLLTQGIMTLRQTEYRRIP